MTSDVEDLQKGDVIVAVRGYLAETQDHYVQLRDLEIFSDFRMVVFRQGKYLELGPYPGHHRFGNLKDYQG